MSESQGKASTVIESKVVPRSHTWRTLENTVEYLLPHLTPKMKLLDLGCGLGTLTVDFARHIPEGQITGIDQKTDVLVKARAYATEQNVKNVDFVSGDVLALPFPDDTFDITHVHQVLQHVTDPVQALREMLRVTKPGGLVAARETDFAAIVWYPEIDGLAEWQKLYMRVARARGGEPEAGRRLHVWARQAGYDPTRVVCSTGSWCLSTPDDCLLWSDLWASQIVQPHIGDVAVEHGIATREDLDRLVKAWNVWGVAEYAWLSNLAGQILYQVEA